jgi:hypothetical protein
MTEAELRQLYPRCFNDERKPLMLGVDRYIHDPQLRATLRAWVQHPDYLNNITAPGAIRIDLAGRPAGVVTEAERQWTLHRPIIPVREPAVIAAEARARGGDDEKVPTTTIPGLYIDGIHIKSRYSKADEYEVLRDAVLRLAPEKRALIADIFCDSKATWVLIVRLRAWNESLAERIGALLSEALLYVNGGHNAITLTSGRDDKVVIHAEWEDLI